MPVASHCISREVEGVRPPPVTSTTHHTTTTIPATQPTGTHPARYLNDVTTETSSDITIATGSDINTIVFEIIEEDAENENISMIENTSVDPRKRSSNDFNETLHSGLIFVMVLISGLFVPS